MSSSPLALTKTKQKTRQKIQVVQLVVPVILILSSAVVMSVFAMSIGLAGARLIIKQQESKSFTVKKVDLIALSTKVANEMEEYRRLPGNIRLETTPAGRLSGTGFSTKEISIDDQNLSSVQYLYLAALLIKDLNQNPDSNPVYAVPKSFKNPNNPYPPIVFKDDFYKYPLNKETYLSFVDQIINNLNTDPQTPDYFTFNEAQIRFDASVHYLASIIRFYDFFGYLPQSMDIKVISPKNLVPADWDTPTGFEQYTSAITYHMNSADDHLYNRHCAADYNTFKLAKEIVGDMPLYEALQSIYMWVTYDTWRMWGYALTAHNPFEYGERSAREAWSMRLSTSGEHDIKMNALYRALGIPAYLNYVYYAPEQRWLGTDVHYPFAEYIYLDETGQMAEGFEDSPLPNKKRDFIQEIQFINHYTRTMQDDITSRSLFINASDVLDYGADAIVQKAKQGGFDTLILTIKTPYGDLYFNPEVTLPPEFYPRIKDDTLNLLLPIAHSEGLKVQIGFDVLADYLTAENHQDWCQWNADSGESDPFHKYYSGMISPCVPEYREILQTILQGIIEKYPIDGIVFMDLQWSVWGTTPETQAGDDEYCKLYYDTTQDGWQKEAIADYLEFLVNAVREADQDLNISYLSPSLAKEFHDQEEEGAPNYYKGVDFVRMSQLVDNFILNIGGYYWLNQNDKEDFFDTGHQFRYDFEKLVNNLKASGVRPSIAFNLRDEWEYPPEFFTGLYEYCEDLGFKGFALYSKVSGWGEWGAAFTESQWDKIQHIKLSIADLFTDSDGDGYSGPTVDCDDTNPAIYPGAPEICDNHIDDDCDGDIDIQDIDCQRIVVRVLNHQEVPLPSIQVNAYRSDGTSISNKKTDEQGRAFFDLDPTQYPQVYFTAIFLRTITAMSCGHIPTPVVSPPAQVTIYRPEHVSSLTVLNPGVVGPGMAYRVNFYDERAWGLVVSPISPADQLTYEFYLPEDEMVYWQVTSSNPPIVIKTEPFTAVVNDVIGLGSDPCQDQDGDGYGYHASLACTKPLQDCDDNNSNIHPRAEEICDDGVDNDCDGLVDLMSGLEDPDCETQ